ncbi:Tetracenomycin-F1 monooxygenase [Rubripirellula obstinata]|uniref:Tetracenomycin-F1 monooxygenase n=1 Tax=Rubripirellula obstinata TaxID=406547 RepID=A0A5B1CF02_9BACT|nr:antibiotic biosynthesis monooxygenase family protein [Rubripirellula obstinata]KAA1258170.1 Tetracenomycin-F1 monooxygenase [Rubripirellula obstinata]
MSTISVDQSVMTLVNCFSVDPAKADELMAVLVEATESVMRHIPGFVSANLHMAEDKRHVVNYAQWRSRADFDAMLARDDAREHMGKAASLCNGFTPVICHVVHAESRASS